MSESTSVETKRLEDYKSRLESDLAQNQKKQVTLRNALKNLEATEYGIKGGIQALTFLLSSPVEEDTDSHDGKDT